MLLPHPVGQPHRVVIVQVGDLRLGPLGPDIVQPLPGAALGHIDYRFVAQLPGRPGHAPSVVAVRSSDKGEFSQLLPDLRLHQRLKGNLLLRPAQPLSQAAGHGIAAAQGLEGVQTEPPGLVLHQHLRHAQLLGQMVQRNQGRRRITWNRLMKTAGPLQRPAVGQGEGRVRDLSLLIDIIVQCHAHSSPSRTATARMGEPSAS